MAKSDITKSATSGFDAATPGFGAPEQVGGVIHRKTDNHPMGKILCLGLSNWKIAFTLFCAPFDPAKKQSTIDEIKKDKFHEFSFNLIEGLLKVLHFIYS